LGNQITLGELHVGPDSLVHIEKCKIFLEVEHKDKIIVAKWDPLPKQINQRKTNNPMKGMKKGEWYINNDCEHSKNQIAYVSKRRKSILYQMTNGLVHEKRKKLVATLFHTLKHGRPTYEYEAHKDLFEFLNFEDSPKMH
jgi:hypothetical protein